LDSVADTLWWWLVAKIASMLVVGALTWIGLVALNVPLAFTLAVIASLLTFIPNIGPVLSAVPAMLLGLLQSPITAVWVALLFIVIQTVESYLITPVFQQRAISLPPALVIAAQVLMGVLSGGLGLIVATPLAAAISVLVKELYMRDVLDAKKP
jgi:predicted PurR-regulated permease PerM